MTGTDERPTRGRPTPERPILEGTRRPTRQRAAVAAVLADNDEFRSAQDLHAILRAAGDTVGLATEHGFTDVHHTLEIFGTCADCSTS